MDEDPHTIEHQKGPGGDFYAVPQRKWREERGQPKQIAEGEKTAEYVHEDPHTIEHQKGPGGDFYAVPQTTRKKWREERGQITDGEKVATYAADSKRRTYKVNM